MALATQALSAQPRGAHQMETVLLALESAVWLPHQLAVPASPPIPPTSGILTTQVPTPQPVLEHVPTPLRRFQMTFANWGWISRPWLASTLAPVELVEWMTLRSLEQLDTILQPFVEQTQDTTVRFNKVFTAYCKLCICLVYVEFGATSTDTITITNTYRSGGLTTAKTFNILARQISCTATWK